MPDSEKPYRPRVLVVEDNEIIVEDLSMILEDCGCEAVGKCPTMQQALTIIDEQQIDIAIVDYLLEDGSAERLCAALDARAIPYAMLSGQRVDTLHLIFPNTPILMKPYTNEDVQLVIDRLMAAKLSG